MPDLSAASRNESSGTAPPISRQRTTVATTRIRTRHFRFDIEPPAVALLCIKNVHSAKDAAHISFVTIAGAAGRSVRDTEEHGLLRNESGNNMRFWQEPP